VKDSQEFRRLAGSLVARHAPPMPQEATNWVPAVAAGIGALAALGGQLVAGLFQRRNQERAEQRQRRNRAAEVLAEATALYEDCNPNLLYKVDESNDQNLWMALGRVM